MVNGVFRLLAISIAMPLYNKADQVLATIASVQAQTITDWELVVVDDGSTDEGTKLIRALDDPRIRIYHQPNVGVSAARNRGVELAHADLIAFLDADDRWQPEFLASVLALVADFPEADWYATGYEIRHPREGVFASRLRGVPKGFRYGILKNYFHVAMQSDPPVWTSATAVRRTALQAIGGFPVGIGSGEDLLTWARLAVRYPLAYDVRPLAVFNVSGIDRRADPANRVGLALEELARQNPRVSGLRAYLGLWYRMQARMALRFGETALARGRAWRAFRYGPEQWRNGYTFMLAWLPESLRTAIDRTARDLIRHFRPDGAP